jgi:hypothetical protein
LQKACQVFDGGIDILGYSFYAWLTKNRRVDLEY